MNRRDFLKTVAGGVVGLGVASLGNAWNVSAQSGFRLWVGPFQWRERISSKTGLPSPAGVFGWRMPVGAIQAFDFRGPQGTQTTNAFSPAKAIFVTPADVTLTAPYVQVATDPLEVLRPKDRTAIGDIFGRTLTSTRFLDLLHEGITGHTDLSRSIICPPPVAQRNGMISWSIAGQVFKSVAVGPSTPEWAGIVARHQADYRKLSLSGIQDLESKYLATLAIKYRLTDVQVMAQFIPSDMEQKPPVMPTTTITESFPGTSGTLGGDLTWTEVSGAWDNVSGVGRFVSAGATGFARAGTDLSTDDMYAQVSVVSEQTNPYGSAAVRFANAATTFYGHNSNRGANDYYCTRYDAGTPTDIITDEQAGSVSLPTTDKITVDGSAVEIFEGTSTSRGSTTDTNISGNTKGGLLWYLDNGFASTFDSWEAGDLAAAATVPNRPRTLWFQ